MKLLPSALTIAGSDSGGGAGIQADLKVFAALGAHGTSAITCITAQNPRRVMGIEPVSADMVRRQIEAVFEELRPKAIKTGMLYSDDIIEVVADFFSRRKTPPLVVDPVMVATSGAKLLKPSAIRTLTERLLPLAALVTPNLDEAEILVGRRPQNVRDLDAAAREIHARFGCAALVKGGHLKSDKFATDVFFDGRTRRVLRASRVKGVSTHGTGCTYSAAVAGFLALGNSLEKSVYLAKRLITGCFKNCGRVGAHTVLRPYGVRPSPGAAT